MKSERRGKELHEKELRRYLEEAKSKGRKIIDLAGKSPDAIEVRLEYGKLKLIAIEVLPSRWSTTYKSWKHAWTYKQKQYSYRMFDEVKILEYRLPKIKG